MRRRDIISSNFVMFVFLQYNSVLTTIGINRAGNLTRICNVTPTNSSNSSIDATSDLNCEVRSLRVHVSVKFSSLCYFLFCLIFKMLLFS